MESPTIVQTRHEIQADSYDAFPRPVPFFTAWCTGPKGTFMLNAGHHWKNRDLAEKFLAEHQRNGECTQEASR